MKYMDKNKVKTAFSYIKESDDFTEKMTKRMDEERSKIPETSKNRRVGGGRRVLTYCVASAAGVVLTVFSILIFMHLNQGDSIIQTGSSTQMTKQTTEQTIKDNTAISANQSTTGISDEVSVYYSDLHFAATKIIEYPSVENSMTGDIMPFLTDDVLSHTEMVVKATITDIHFNDYSDTFYDTSTMNCNILSAETIVYQITIDKIYFAKEDLAIHEGDQFTIEDPLGTESPCLKDSVYQLQINRQYIFPVSYMPEVAGSMESPFHLSYSIYPQIECTEDAGYVFFVLYPKIALGYGGKSYTWYGWGELVNTETVPIIMDQYEQEGYKVNLKGNMYLRMDSNFESDVQALCDKWCV